MLIWRTMSILSFIIAVAAGCSSGDSGARCGDGVCISTESAESCPQDCTACSDVDSDGICDDEDDCVGALDACGVCNGPGAITPCGCEGCPEFSECGDVLEYEGQYYETTQIGEQCWFAENLRYLPQVDPPENNSTNEARYYVYGYYGESVDEAQALSWFHDFGVLYNFPAILMLPQIMVLKGSLSTTSIIHNTLLLN